MSYKGMRGTTLKYMNSIDKQSKSLRRNIKNIKKRDRIHRTYFIYG